MANQASNTASSSKALGYRPKQSLAATHPSHYAQAARKNMPPPPMAQRQRKPKKTKEAPASKAARTLSYGYPTPSPSPQASVQQCSPADREHERQPNAASTSNRSLEASVASASKLKTDSPKQKPRMPWQMHTDPTFTTSDAPVFWTRNHTVLKADSSLDHGSTFSPTTMHGLPFGSMTEAAYHYPEEERLARG